MTDFWTNKSVLVVGGAGWLGSCLCSVLVDSGAVVAACDILEQPSAPWRAQGLDSRVQYLHRDATNVDNILLTLRGWVEHNRPAEIVFHMGGKAHIGACQRDPEGTIRANVVGAFGVLEACRRYRDEGGALQGLVIPSSNHTYRGGRQGERRAMQETDRLDASDLYGASKAMADHLARAYAASFNLPIAILRHLNCYGPFDPEPSRIVPSTILTLLDRKAPVIKSDGTPVKGYIYLDDLMAAYLHAAELVATDPGKSGAYNVGGVDQTISVLALVDKLIYLSGLDLVPDIRSEDLSQSGYVEILDDSRFRATGWAPKVPLGVGLAWTYDFYEQRGGMAWLTR